MRLGIDFGTTHTVAALVDRGNYPVVSFEWGDSVASLLAVRRKDGAVRYGHQALELAGDPSWSARSSASSRPPARRARCRPAATASG